ncbi:extracellular solute-binding protein [Nonomuraea sp. PA05]|uniref:ABC transporter substrate-binding protein n=1 Tax=Nonomuraea sp. PA05 TaxID=2604466 RepID=UPI0011DC570E|nr:extracellular solute-binding protein [Nonomuraea sp. PA05]TYB50546.1 extracellular solute-binding protein [Nonomuraea sp. PA05]
MTDRSYTRRGFLALSSVAATGLAVSACTGASVGGGTTTAAPSDKLRLFTYEDDATIGSLKAQVRKFDQQNGTTTTVDSLPGSGAAQYPDKLRTELLGGSGPDIWRIWGGQLGAPFAKAKQAADLAPYYQRFGWDSSISAAAIQGMTFDGVKAGVPFTARGIGAWYNKELLAKAGIEAPPATYAELEEMNEQLVAAGITPCGLGGKYGWHVMRLFEYLLEHTTGPQLHDKLLLGQESWDRPEVVEAFTLFKKWQDSKWLPEGALGLDPADVGNWYVQGKVAYDLEGQWSETTAILAAKKDPKDFGVFQLPTGHSPARHSGFVEGYMVNAHSGNKDKAAALLDFLLKPDSQKAMQITSSTVKGAEADPAVMPLSAGWDEKYGSSPFYTIQDQAFPKQQSDQYFSVQSDLLQGKVTPAAAARKMQEIVSAWARD